MGPTYRNDILKFIRYAKLHIKDAIDQKLEGRTKEYKNSKEWADFYLRHVSFRLNSEGRFNLAIIVREYLLSKL